ncbi:MFS transporter [Mobilicoccus caccae]|uniref:MFS transporter n=1 Tax=Mobilicoccus caccae TaxID=1859295 RepID=A0ABQ6IVW3_9MICO|nr:MFS transporter [Mobilicoccus caccae]GMA41756.1 MFS transporter [Mobilicoccus caccae]
MSSIPQSRDVRGDLSPGARRALFASMVGTLIEWYDYALYGAAAALIIGPLFFPGSIDSAAQMAAFATFAVGFVVRPLGGLIVAHIGDTFGRKPAMILTIVLMGAATVGIGLLPTAASIGVWAPILLVVFRLLQGFGAGAELAGAMTVVAEFTPVRRRGFFTALVLSAPPAGTLLATLAFLAVSWLPTPVLLGWAWRIPFLISAVLFFVALYIRNRMEETPEFAHVARRQSEARRQAVPVGQLLRGSWRNVITAFLAVTGHNANNYILAAFSLSFMTKVAGMPRGSALLAVSIASLFGVVGSPVGGWLADRFGAGRIMGIGAAIGMLYAYPLFLAMQSGNVLIATLVLCFGYGVVLSMTSGAQGAFLTNLFPIRYRFSGVAMSRELNGAIVAGNTPLIATALIAAAGGGIHLAAGFLAVCFAVTILAVVLARGKADSPHAETEEDSRDAAVTPGAAS